MSGHIGFYILGISMGLALSGLLVSIGVWNAWITLALVIICATCGSLVLRRGTR